MCWYIVSKSKPVAQNLLSEAYISFRAFLVRPETRAVLWSDLHLLRNSNQLSMAVTWLVTITSHKRHTQSFTHRMLSFFFLFLRKCIHTGQQPRVRCCCFLKKNKDKKTQKQPSQAAEQECREQPRSYCLFRLIRFNTFIFGNKQHLSQGAVQQLPVNVREKVITQSWRMFSWVIRGMSWAFGSKRVGTNM